MSLPNLDFSEQFTTTPPVHWRPSYKQMEALKWTIDALETYDQIVPYLEELFEELKEL